MRSYTTTLTFLNHADQEICVQDGEMPNSIEICVGESDAEQNLRIYLNMEEVETLIKMLQKVKLGVGRE